jgi:asparagine synthase (glutamine-hydrolysing)
MTALAGVFGPKAAESAASPYFATMLSRMRNRGTAIPEQFAARDAFVATRRHEWDVDQHGWTGPTITIADDWVIAADASLYYLADLRQKLSQHHPPLDRGADSGALVLAALRVWGDRFARYLEGDLAIVALHRASNRVLLTRDFAGKRSLTFGRTAEGTLVVASSPRAVIAHPGISSAFDRDFIAASIAGLHGHGHRTAFSSVAAVPGGATLAFEDGIFRVVDQWSPPAFSSDWEESSSDHAADHLRHLIEQAVVERLPDRGVAAVWMSGGWDSTSIFAAGRSALGRSGKESVRLIPVSLRYPEGDIGDEAAFIESIANRWNTEIHWVPVDTIALFEDADRRAAVRDDPRVHPFESQIRTLSQVSRSLGVRVAHDGAGGDHLFAVSTAAVLADHLRSGRFGHLLPDWKAWGRRNLWTFARAVLLPQLSRATLEWIGSVRGRPLPGFWDSSVPPWVRVTPGLLEEGRAEETRDPGEGAAAWETRDTLTSPLVARALSWNHAIAQEEGVLLRSPLFDPRVIAFAARRPLNERRGGPDSKGLLRRSMRDLLPPEVLEPRSRKTGTPVHYFRRQMTESAVGEFHRLFEGRESHLAALEIIDTSVLGKAVEEYKSSGAHAVGALLQLTLEAERWLAAQVTEG